MVLVLLLVLLLLVLLPLLLLLMLLLLLVDITTSGGALECPFTRGSSFTYTAELWPLLALLMVRFRDPLSTGRMAAVPPVWCRGEDELDEIDNDWWWWWCVCWPVVLLLVLVVVR